jgi:hypothetical protein
MPNRINHNDVHASLEFHLRDKETSSCLSDRLYILYYGVDYKMRDFSASLFPGTPYGSDKPVRGIDILKKIDSHIKKLYKPYYEHIEKNIATTEEMKDRKWLAVLTTFIINYFSEKDSTMDVDFNMGVISFVPSHPLPYKADVFINPFT